MRLSLFALVLSACLLSACNLPLAGDASLGSAACSAQTGPVNPKPPLPNFLQAENLRKRAFFSRKIFDLPDNSPLTPLISPLTLPQKHYYKKGARFTIVNFPHCPRAPAETLTLARDMSTDELKNIFFQNDCLATISPEINLHTLAATNDPEYANQTHLESIHATEAYDFLLGGSGPTSPVVVAIIDTGVDIDHTDLAANVWINTGEVAANGIDDDNNGYVDDRNGYNFASNIANPRPQAWPAPNTGGESHGTHVAGLTAARAGNAIGIAGVMGQNIQIMSLNVFGATPSATTASLINAIYYAADNGADIINLSLGGYGVSESVNQALKVAVASGVTVFAAAGNDASLLDDSLFMLPASYAQSITGMLSVGATDDANGAISWFSNYSARYVEIAAPGTHSSYAGLKSTLPGNLYGYKQGTSMATPVAAGVGAWAVSYLRSLGQTASPTLVEQLIQESSETIPALYGYVLRGQRINLLNLVNKISDCY